MWVPLYVNFEYLNSRKGGNECLCVRGVRYTKKGGEKICEKCVGKREVKRSV
jgi:hypothetical protein